MWTRRFCVRRRGRRPLQTCTCIAGARVELGVWRECRRAHEHTYMSCLSHTRIRGTRGPHWQWHEARSGDSGHISGATTRLGRGRSSSGCGRWESGLWDSARRIWRASRRGAAVRVQYCWRVGVGDSYTLLYAIRIRLGLARLAPGRPVLSVRARARTATHESHMTYYLHTHARAPHAYAYAYRIDISICICARTLGGRRVVSRSRARVSGQSARSPPGPPRFALSRPARRPASAGAALRISMPAYGATAPSLEL